MKKQFLKLWAILPMMAFVVACNDDDAVNDVEEELNFAEMESDWVRLSLMKGDKIDLMQPNTGEMHGSVSGPLTEGARYYTSNSGRYSISIEREQNVLRFFDSGIENHEDHGHEVTPKWLDITVEAPLPTHYASSDGHIVIFNDGDGSITHINEAQLELPAYQPNIITFPNTVAHHGAGFRLQNGKFAITFKNTDEPGGVPQLVKFVDSNGNVIDDNGGVEVAKIHGDAVNGKYGVFGATEGVILVDDADNIDLIEYPEDQNFSEESGFWIGTLKGHDHSDIFFGRAGSLGVFKIDPVAKSITNIYAGADVVADMFSFDGEYYLVHTSDNKIRVFDAHDGEEIANRVVEMADIPEEHNHRTALSEIEQLRKMDDPSPVLVTSDKFLYILAPNRMQIKVLEIADLHHVHTIELSAPVESMMKNGFSIEGDQGHDHEH